jgi:hypothetical protein
MATTSETQSESETLHQQNLNSTHDDGEDQQQPHPQPQSANSETLETPDPQITQSSDLQDQALVLDAEEQNQDDTQDLENEEQFCKSPSPSPFTLNTYRRTNIRRRKLVHAKKQQAIDKKVQALLKNFNPIPFNSSKPYQYEKHEKLLKRLGLWDFINISFDQELRVDLLAQLIASHQKKRGSLVNGYRVNLDRPSLARALKLPIKKEKANNLEEVDLDSEYLSEDAVMFLGEFLSEWVVLHDEAWTVPDEFTTSMRAIKDSHPEKVDWARLFWMMVEKELSQGLKLTNCYYASHLQQLIKSQKEDVLMEEPKMEIKVEEVKEEDDIVENKLETSDNLKIETVNESDGRDQPSFELTLGQDSVEDKEEVKEDEQMDVDESKEELGQLGQPGQWLFDGKNGMGQHFMQPCQIEEGRKMEEEEEEEDIMEDGFHIDPDENGSDPVGDGLTGNLLQGMEESHMPFDFSSELIPSRSETHTIVGGPSIFGKREMDHNNGINSNKRMRNDGMWDQELSDPAMCMAQIQHYAEKARSMFESKEQEYQQANMNQGIMLNQYQERNAYIEHMYKAKCEELQKKDAEMYRLERELYIMGNLLEGYRKALKETDKAFTEYRQKFQLPEESVYKDAGPGGVVLGPIELEMERVKKAEEDRLNKLIIEQKLKEFEEGCVGDFDLKQDRIKAMEEKLSGLENKVKQMKESHMKKKKKEKKENEKKEKNVPEPSEPEAEKS